MTSAARAIHVRAATPADAPSVAPLLGELGYPSTIEDVRTRLARLVADGDAHVIVAERDDEIVGVASLIVMPMLHASRDVAWITAFVVSSTARRAGVGRALVAELERIARQWQCARIAVTSAERRADAHAFYEGLGFAYTGRRFVKPLPT